MWVFYTRMPTRNEVIYYDSDIKDSDYPDHSEERLDLNSKYSF